MQAPPDPIECALARALARLDPLRTALDYWRQEELAVLPALVPAPLVQRLTGEIDRLESRVVRRHVPGYKRGGSIAYPALRKHAPTATALYRSPSLTRFVSGLSERELLPCPDDDPHACAVYWYAAPGDRIGYHYDTSWYRGARYTVLLGLVDASSAHLSCQLHARDRHRPTRELRVRTTPGTLVVFNGDKLRHGVTALGVGERRVVLSLQYVTDRRIGRIGRLVSQVKDSVAYFGADALRPGHKRLGFPVHIKGALP